MDTKDVKDYLNNQGKINNDKYNYYTNDEGFLNNPANPFIRAINKIESENIQIIEKDNYNIGLIKNEQEKKLIKNTKKLYISNAKVIDDKDISLDENNLKGDKKANNYWYTKFSFLDKPF